MYVDSVTTQFVVASCLAWALLQILDIVKYRFMLGLGVGQERATNLKNMNLWALFGRKTGQLGLGFRQLIQFFFWQASRIK